MDLDREGAEALHRQLSRILRKKIDSGEIAPGQQLPTEAELEREFAISIPTIRKALKTLKDEGLIESRAGLGTFAKGEAADSVPLTTYERIAMILRKRITSGEIPPGRRIPGMHALEAEFGVAYGTLIKAVQLLRDEGLVETAVGKGVYVVRRPDHSE